MTLPKKSLGQNFITDNKFLEKLDCYIESSKNITIVEIGPGRGALTNFLIQKNFKNLYLIEKDNELASSQKKKYKNIKNIKIFNEDALNFNYQNLNKENSKVAIYGNLPFNISTKLLTLWLSGNVWPSFFDKMILMFQKEVADRIIANHNNKKYGRLSVLVQSRCKTSKLIEAPASIFTPKPKVDGAVIQFEPIKEHKHINFQKLELLLEKSFSSRRKKIKTTLKEHRKLMLKLHIDENLRPENISVSDYCKLVEMIN